MNSYKLIACDIDGTLLASDLSLSEENIRAMRELTEQGVLIVPITGRALCEMEDIYNLPEVRYVIYSNGAVIYDKETSEKIFCGFDDELACFVAETLGKYDTFPIIHKDGKTYTDKWKTDRLNDYHIGVSVKHMVKDCSTLDENIDDRYFEGGVESVTVFFANEDERQECIKILASNPDLYAAQSWDHNLEIFFKDAGKGNALKILAEKLGMTMDNVISIGDSDNDRQMTLMSGLGLVTDNACKTLKEIADKVICSNDENVISYVKKHYFDKVDTNCN